MPYPNSRTYTLYSLKHLVVLALLVLVLSAQGQMYNGATLNFGKSRVQYYTDKFIWSFYRFERYDVYFYTGGRNLAEYTARCAQARLPEIEKFYDYTFDGRIQFVVYNRNSQYVQSNVGLDTEGGEQNGMGLVQVNGNKVFLYFDGNHAHLEKQIAEGISRVIFHQFMQGSNMRDRTRWLPVTGLPTWFSEGVISYAANRWDYEADNRMADAMQNPNFFKLNRLNNEQAALAGRSIWNYIAIMYSESIISRILYMTKMSRSANSGLLYMLGLNQQALVADWVNFCDKQYPVADDSLRKSIIAMPVLKPKKDRVYYHLQADNAGLYHAFIANRWGRFKVYLYNNNTTERTLIYKGGEQSELPTDYSYPLLAWHPSLPQLTMLEENKGELWLVDYDLDKKTTTKRPLYLFDKVVSMAYMPDGQNLLVSAVREGITDIYLYNLPTNTYKALTADLADDLSPIVLKDAIIFSSNRYSDSLKPNITQPLLPTTYDLYRLPLKGKPITVQRATNTPQANEFNPIPYDSTHIAYLSNQSGISNRYLASFDSTIAYIDTSAHYRFIAITKPLSNSRTPILEQSAPTNGGSIAVSTYDKGKPYMYVGPNNLVDGPEGNKPYPTRYAQYGPDTAARRFKNPISIGQGERIKVFEDDTTTINIDNYIFGDGSNKPAAKKPIADTAKATMPDSFRLPKQRIYLTSFYTEGFVSKFDRGFLNQGYQPFSPGGYINPYPNAMFKVTLKDVMEDYRITGAFRLSANFVGNEYLLRFENLKHRLDRELTLHRMGVQNNINSAAQIHVHQVIYGIRYPFKQTLWVKASATGRLDRTAFRTSETANLTRNSEFAYWGALNAEAVYDNTLKGITNILYGTRTKVWAEFYNRFDQRKTNTTIIGIDFRHYQRISRSFIAAFRVSASTSFGPGKLMYYLGGVDGWLIPRYDQNAQLDQSNTYLFQALANGLRGFTQNIRSGNTFVMASAELRFPIFNCLFNYNIKSEFLNNFQLVAFADAGSAYVGLNPYAEKNTYVTNVVQQGPLNITVKTQREPFIAGLGWGLRTKILGYFLRADFANGIQDGKFAKTRFYLSVGTDF